MKLLFTMAFSVWAWSLIGSTEAVAAEDALAAELAAALESSETIPGTRLVVLAPEGTPLSRNEAELLLNRLATLMNQKVDDALDISLPSSDIRAALGRIYANEGIDGWRQAIDAIPSGVGDLALTAEIGPHAHGLKVQARLLDMDRHRTLVITSPQILPLPQESAGNPKESLRLAFRRLVAVVPEARVGIAVLPFKDGQSRAVTRGEQMIQDLAKAAWLDAGYGEKNDLNAGFQPRIVDDPTQASIHLAGLIWRIDALRIRVLLTLRRDSSDLATEVVDLSIQRLPDFIRVTFDPNARRPGTGYEPLLGIAPLRGQDWLRIELTGGRDDVYRVCADTTPSGVVRCDKLGVTIRSSRAGSILCLAGGDNGDFSILSPQAGKGIAPAVWPDKRLSLPESLPPLQGGARHVWPAIGPPGAARVVCMLYESHRSVPLTALGQFHGRRLSPDEMADVARMLTASGPMAIAQETASIVPDTWR